MPIIHVDTTIKNLHYFFLFLFRWQAKSKKKKFWCRNLDYFFFSFHLGIPEAAKANWN